MKAPRKKKSVILNSIVEPRKKLEVGNIIWAQFTSTKWYPAVIVDPKHVDKQGREGKFVVLWFFDHLISYKSPKYLCSFMENYSMMYKKNTPCSSSWLQAVLEALKELSIATYPPLDLFNWAINGFPNYTERPNVVPASMIESFKKIAKQTYEKPPVVSEVRRSTTPTPCKRKRYNSIHRHLDNEALERIAAAHHNKHQINFCLACYEKEPQFAHPHFEGGLCGECKDRMLATLKEIGPDGVGYNCVICASPGDLVKCQEECCPRVYCSECLDKLAAPNARSILTATDNWACFVCTGINELSGVLIPKANINQRIHRLTYNVKLPIVKNPTPTPDKTKKIRVLSLFDGIATAKLVLQNLKLDVDVYYASEIDENVKDIAIFNFEDGIRYLGDVRSITDETIRQISPLHLVIGGSPCNEFSRANPKRKGLYDFSGTGPLFFEFVRILNSANTHNPDGLYWLYENVASMSPKIEMIMSRHLQCESVCLDSSIISPQRRARLFWSNCPNLKSNLFTYQKPELQSFLMHGRTAKYTRLRTVTTKSNSLLQGPNREYPVLDRLGNDDSLWVTELEKVLGFPVHYSDTGNLSNTERLKALGQSWNVGVIQHILGFLPDLFAVKQATDEDHPMDLSNDIDEATINMSQYVSVQMDESMEAQMDDSSDEEL